MHKKILIFFLPYHMDSHVHWLYLYFWTMGAVTARGVRIMAEGSSHITAVHNILNVALVFLMVLCATAQAKASIRYERVPVRQNTFQEG